MNKIDTTIVPDELSYLVEPSQKYKDYRFAEQLEWLSQNISKEELESLQIIAEKVRHQKDYVKVNRWLDRFKMTKYPIAADIYFLFGVMDALDIVFD
ncbi:MAG: hypothetical protein LBH00_07760 [Planctomycetaceae bacterium]|jgi:hypothetical protein|nr:hypothetical protein [Planctomycetaceae bacterium]